MKYVVSIALLAALLFPTAASAADGSRGWGFGAGIFDGEFGVHARKDIYLGGDINEFTLQGSLIFANKTAGSFDADYHFLIKQGNSRFYPLAGLNFVFSDGWSEFGANAGGGVNFMLTETLGAFAEAKYVLFGWDAFVFTAGIKF